ncbi:MAG: hypothetical protein ABI759_13570 [Candidatus Solibacter sp.]
MLQRLVTPSLLDVFFCALLLGAFAQPAGVRSLLSDGDTGWHIRTGELVLQTGRIPQADPFSFSRPGEPWFAWEWLSDVVLALVWRWRGLAGVAALFGGLLALAATVLLARLLRQASGLWIAVLVALAAVSASSVHYLARPHAFSILFYTVAIWVFCEDRARPGPWVWLLVPLTALWVNLHGGFVAWLMTLGLAVLECASRGAWRQARRYGLLGALCALASLANPHGWQLHWHIVRYLNSSWIMEHVAEFQSPAIRSEGMIVFAFLLLAAVALSARSDRFTTLLVLVWGFLALRSARHIPFFAIVAAPVVAAGAARYWERAMAQARAGSAVRVFWDLAQELGDRPRASLWPLAAAVLLLVNAPGAGFSAERFPVQAVERNLGQITPTGAMPRMLTSDQWADYVIYRLYPSQRVFFDGRSDFFGPAIGADYRALMLAQTGWREALRNYGFEVALLPRDWVLGTVLDREPDWQRVYEDRVAVLYVRRGAEKSAGSGASPPAEFRTSMARGRP